MHCITVSVVNYREWDEIKKYSLVIYAVGAYLGLNPRDDSFGYVICDLVKCKSADIKDYGVPVSAYTAEAVFNTLHLTGIFSRNSDVYAGALGNGLQLLSPGILEVESTSVFIVGYKEPLLSLSLWTRVKILPIANITIWLWLGPLIAVIFVLVTTGTAISAYCCYKKKKKNNTVLNPFQVLKMKRDRH